MSYDFANYHQRPFLEELETRELWATGFFSALPLVAPPSGGSSTAPAVVHTAPTQQTAPAIVTSPSTGTSPANLNPAAQGMTSPGTQSTAQTGQGSSTSPTNTLANQTAFLEIQNLTTPTSAVPGSPTPGTANSALTQPALSVNPADPTLLAGRSPVLAYNLIVPENQYVVRPSLLLYGGGGDPVEQPVDRVRESEPGPDNVILESDRPADVIPASRPPAPPQVPLGVDQPVPKNVIPESDRSADVISAPQPPASPQVPLGVDQPVPMSDARPDTQAQPAVAGDQLFASLTQNDPDLVPGLDELALAPGVLNLILASSMLELAR